MRQLVARALNALGLGGKLHGVSPSRFRVGSSARAVCWLLPLLLFACGEETQSPSNDVCNPADDPSANVFVSAFDESTACLPRSLGQEGHTSCQVVVARVTPCDCSAGEGLRVAPRSLDDSVRSRLSEEMGGDTAGTSCHELCVCELIQLEGAALTDCQNDVNATGPAGFCYVDPAAGAGVEALVADCPANSQRRFRFLGGLGPGDGNRWFLSCLGGS